MWRQELQVLKSDSTSDPACLGLTLLSAEDRAKLECFPKGQKSTLCPTWIMIHMAAAEETAVPSRSSIFKECLLAKNRVLWKLKQDHLSQ